MAKSIIVLASLLCCVQASADAQSVVTSPQGSIEPSLSILAKLLIPSESLNMEEQSALLKKYELSDAQIKDALSIVNGTSELSNLDGEVARKQSQSSQDLPSLERRRRELLATIAAALQKKLGTSAFNSLLQSIAKQTRARRSVCDPKAVVYTFWTTLRPSSSMTIFAVADAGYQANHGRLYAEATVTSPSNREVAAKSPPVPDRTYTIAIARIPIAYEDGAYQSRAAFGELCGEQIVPQMYVD